MKSSKPFFLGWILLTALQATTFYAHSQTTVTTCEQQSTYHYAPTNTWTGLLEHSSGSHQVGYQFYGRCDYTTVTATDAASCETDQENYAVFPTVTDDGQVTGYPDAYHSVLTATQTAQAHNTSGSTSTNTQAGAAVFHCSHISGCGVISVSVPPFTVTSGHAIEQNGSFTYSDACPAKVYYKRVCAYNKRLGITQCTGHLCCSPLMLDLSGLGPFASMTGNVSGSDIYQLTGLEDGIRFKLEKTGPTWDKTKPQRISWTRPGSKMAVLVLPDDEGRIETSEQLFGNNTTCADDKPCDNGFAALAYKCDSKVNGGNEDGVCDQHDGIFPNLRLLLGRPNSPQRQLLTPFELGIVSFDVKNYAKLTGQQLRKDEHGNAFRYQGSYDAGWKQVGDGRQSDIREMYDVYLLVEEPSNE